MSVKPRRGVEGLKQRFLHLAHPRFHTMMMRNIKRFHGKDSTMINRLRWMTPVFVIALTLLACAGILPPGGGTEAPGGGQFPPAEIQNDEGGPVTITGEVTYTNPFFTAG